MSEKEEHPVSQSGHKNDRDVDPQNSEEGQDQPAKKAKVEDVATCVVCFEEGSESSPILSTHQCPQCSKGAWNICLVCNEGLLSRTCPVCRGDYAPMVMHLIPGPPLKKLADPNIDIDERTKLLYKFGVIRQVIGRSNVAIWSNVSKKMYFSLPQEIPSSNDEQTDVTYSVVTVPMDESCVEGDQFLFSNRVWDLIENEVEHGAVHAGREVALKDAMNFILDVTKEEGHKFYTMMTPQDWDYMMDPGESTDTSEALRVIRNGIVEPLLNLIPSAGNTPRSDVSGKHA